MRRYVVIAAALLVLVCMLATVAALGFFLLPREVARPLVSIESPRAGARVTMGEPVPVHSIARDSHKLSRVEFWVDGVLQTAEQASLPGGISPFPLATQWHPRAAGPHTLTVRAFNTQGGRSFASVDVQVVEISDRDRDGVPDAADVCPDQPGSEGADGCPDRDNDQIRDADDACPDQPGTREGRGCPTPSDGDRDGDGVADSADACPDQPGTAATCGCPDQDGDGVRDAADACPDQPGSQEGRGCPGVQDRDGDGVADTADTCPDDPGVVGSAGCPDRDGDQVRDAFDLCPDTPGARENSGCPVTGSGDQDNDGVRDDTDLAPAEAGSADSGGAPPPGGGVDGDGDMVPDDEEGGDTGLLDETGGVDIEGVIPLSELVWMEFDALQFELSAEYPAGTAIYCYAGLGSGPVEQIGPFDSLGQRRWDIAEWSGGANSRRFLYPRSHPLDVRADCYVRIRDLMGTDHLRSLGGFHHQHPSFEANEREYDGRIQTGDSTGGEEGQTFRVVYRLCSPSCATYDSQFGVAQPELQAPVISLDRLADRHLLRWTWPGDRSTITNFRAYLGNQILGSSTGWSSMDITSWPPPCGGRHEIYMTAVRRNSDGALAESPRSNTVVWQGDECQRRVRVTFESVRFGDIGTDEDGERWGGPFDATFRVSDATREYLFLVGGACSCGGHWCSGVWVRADTEYTVQSLYDAVQAQRDDCFTQLCMGRYEVPNTDQLTAYQSPEDNLGIRVIFHESDSPSCDDDGETFFNGVIELRPEEITNGTKTIRSGSSEFTVRLEVLDSE